MLLGRYPEGLYGRSPRARGNRNPAGRHLRCHGSTPAGTGKPASGWSLPSNGRGDPRGHGETPVIVGRLRCWPGRSPRGTGKPVLPASTPSRTRVDPRGRGEIIRCSSFEIVFSGRSPRARGNPEAGQGADQCHGSIPAGTGEAGIAKEYNKQNMGQSPQVRGSQDSVTGVQLPAGSIPAGAGKPSGPARSPAGCRVNPRRHGEAATYSEVETGLWGRSPQAQGNRFRMGLASLSGGSIPAGTGKPLPPPAPRLRLGSIPACTGKPWWPGMRGCPPRVDPRGHGEIRPTPPK